MVNSCVICKKSTSKDCGRSIHRSSSTSPDERPVTPEPLDTNKLGSVRESSKLSNSELSRTLTASDLSATLTTSDLSATLTASDLSDTLTASDLSAFLTDTESSGALTVSELSGTMTASESSSNLVSSEVLTVAHPTTSEAKSSVPRPRKRKCFVGDVRDEDFRTPKQGKFAFSLAKRKIAEQKKKLKALRMKNRRLQQKISDISGLLNNLREMNLISDNAQDYIEASLPGPSRDMVNRLIRGSKNQKFTPSLREKRMAIYSRHPNLSLRYAHKQKKQ
ncbi:uncharacterized protein LOC123673257 [Harmonia axyridis]|uniref:uncharacterized protein LOC123673257 n=1 Tax=Harmonia axyridis TaxID=115357 RepID=UPI001E2759CB|nr:uncharacterized protein LOC123673257 [Harmonia axyridis]